MTARPIYQDAARRPQCGNGGFTLIELIISIVLIGLLAAVGTTMISDSFDTTTMLNASQTSAAKARYALERVEREIREVGYDASATPTPAYRTSKAAMTPDSFTFTRSDGTTVVKIERIGVNLSLIISGTTYLLANNVNDFALTYWQIDAMTGNVTTTDDPAKLRFVDIALTVRDGTSGQSIPQLTRVALRNAG